MTTFNKAYCQELRQDINEALAKIEEKHNIVFSAGNARYTDTSATFQLTASAVSPTGEVIRPEEEAFKKHASYYGFDPADLGRQFVSGSRTFTIIGLKTRNSKYPIIGKETISNGRFKFSAQHVKAALLGTYC